MLLSMTGRSERRPKLTTKLTLELPHMPQKALPKEAERVRTNDPRELAEVVLVLRAKADVAITQRFLMGIAETATMLEFTVSNLARNTSQFVTKTTVVIRQRMKRFIKNCRGVLRRRITHQ